MTEALQEYTDQQAGFDNLPANESQMTQNRRAYPKNLKGGKEEWLGIEHHQYEINQELKNLERNIKDLKKNDLSANYNAKIIDQLEKRQAYLENKKKEGEIMQMKGQEFKEELMKMKRDRDEFRAFMKQGYDYNVSEKQQNRKMELEDKLNYENALLEYNRQRLESEKRRRMENKMNQKKDVEQQLELATEKHKMEQMQKMSNEQEIVYLNQQNAMKEIMKEESYKKFYQQWSENDEKLKQIHANNVTNQTMARKKQLEQLIERQVDDYKRKLLQDELNRLQKFNNEKNSMIYGNNEQLKYKGTQKDMEIADRQAKQEQRLTDLKSYNDYLMQQKAEKQERQNQYREYLQKQAEENNTKKVNSSKMPNAEKRMNYLDLQAYKEANPQSYTQLIGYSPQIGAYSNRIKAVPDPNGAGKVMVSAPNLFTQTANKLKSLSPGLRNKDYEAKDNVIIPPQGNALPNSTKNVPFTTKNNIFGDSTAPENNNNSLPFRRSPLNSQVGNSSGHNPLTNPLPMNLQNPYIAREYAKAQNSKNIFSNVADRNLINKT